MADLQSLTKIRDAGWLIRSRRGDFAILRRADYARENSLPSPLHLTEREIAEWARDLMLRHSLIRIYESVYGDRIIHPLRTGTDWLAQRIYDAIDRGDLVVIDATWEFPVVSVPTEEEEPSTAPAASPKAVETTWFRARLLDEDGKTMAGENYVLTDTKGVRTEGKLDANGEVYIPSDLPSGNCTISFPNIHLNPRKRK